MKNCDKEQKKKQRYLDILRNVDAGELALVDGIIDEVVFCEIEMEQLRNLPFVVTKPGDPSRQKSTPAARLYKQYQAAYSNNIRILLNVLRKVESDAADDLSKMLEEYM